MKSFNRIIKKLVNKKVAARLLTISMISNQLFAFSAPRAEAAITTSHWDRDNPALQAPNERQMNYKARLRIAEGYPGTEYTNVVATLDLDEINDGNTSLFNLAQDFYAGPLMKCARINDYCPEGSTAIGTPVYDSANHLYTWTANESLNYEETFSYKIYFRPKLTVSEGAISHAIGRWAYQWEGNPRTTQSDGEKYVIHVADLNIQKYPDGTINQGETFSWTIQLTSNGAPTEPNFGKSYNTKIVDTVPAGLVIVDAGGGQVVGNTITWDLGTLNGNVNGSPTVVTKTITVRGDTVGTFTNTGIVDAYNIANIPGQHSDTAQLIVNAVTVPSIEIQKT
ncbi:MAG TPA: hypothetical protein PKL83_01715, partial [bacterium]|nr:hypothetical protein [bacterium]